MIDFLVKLSLFFSYEKFVKAKYMYKWDRDREREREGGVGREEESF